MSAQPAPVTHLHPITGGTRNGPVLVAAAIEAFLAAPRLAGSPNTRRAYGDVLHRVAERLGPDRELAAIADDELGNALTALWGAAAPSTWNTPGRQLVFLEARHRARARVEVAAVLVGEGEGVRDPARSAAHRHWVGRWGGVVC